MLIKSIDVSNTTNSIDLVFATYWLPPKTGAEILLKDDIKCIADKIKKAMSLNGSCSLSYFYTISNILMFLQLSEITTSTRLQWRTDSQGNV